MYTLGAFRVTVMGVLNLNSMILNIIRILNCIRKTILSEDVLSARNITKYIFYDIILI